MRYILTRKMVTRAFENSLNHNQTLIFDRIWETKEVMNNPEIPFFTEVYNMDYPGMEDFDENFKLCDISIGDEEIIFPNIPDITWLLNKLSWAKAVFSDVWEGQLNTQEELDAKELISKHIFAAEDLFEYDWSDLIYIFNHWYAYIKLCYDQGIEADPEVYLEHQDMEIPEHLKESYEVPIERDTQVTSHAHNGETAPFDDYNYYPDRHIYNGDPGDEQE